MTSRVRFNLSKTTLLFALFMAFACAERVKIDGTIPLAKRSIALLETDVVIYTNDIDFEPKD